MLSVRRNSFLPTFLILIGLGFLIKFCAPNLTHYLYHNHLHVLNALTHSPTSQDLIFYQGRIEEIIWGPLYMTLFGVAFMLALLKYGCEFTPLQFGLSVLAYLLVTKFEVLFFPLYGDTASGPFMEAIWLRDHNFDFVGLSKEPLFDDGGAKTYLFTIYPAFMGLLLKLIPNPKVFLVINHLLSFIMTAVTLATFRQIVLRIANCKQANLLSVLLLSLPIVQSQAEAINMEMPLTMFGVLSVYFLTEKRVALAAIMAILAALVKIAGVILCATVFVVGAFLFLFDEKRFRISQVLWGILAAALGLGLMYFSYLMFNKGGDVNMIGFFQGWPQNKVLPVTYLSLASLLIFLGMFFKEPKRDFIGYLQKNFVVFVVLITVICWFGFFLQSWGAQYRYRLLLAPFSLLIIYYGFTQLVRSLRAIHVTLIACIIFSFICSYGLIFPHTDISEHSALERTLEYRNDLKVHQMLAKELEQKYSHMMIAAPFTIAHILAFPELGFVTKKLDVMMYGFPSRYPNIRPYRGLQELNLRNTMWVGFKTGIPPSLEPVLKYYPYGPEDVVVDTISYGDRRATLFMGGLYVERQWQILLTILKQRRAAQP